jgi:tetratricopeptide (TPR) repeat protein
LLGTYFSNKRTNEALAKSIDYFHEAVVYDPKFAAAHAGLADSYFWLAYHEGDPEFRRESFERSRTSALKGIEIDPNTAEGHAALATVKIKNDGDAEGAEASFREAISADPNCAMAFSRYTYFLAAMGRLNDASRMIRRAHEIDPLSPDANSSLAMILYMQRDYDEAIRYCRTALALEPGFSEAMLLLGRCYQQKGAFSEAATQYEKAKSESAVEANELLSHLLALTGKNALAEAILSDLATIDACDTRSFNIAATYAALREHDTAFEWLERPFINWTERLRILRFDPRLDILRTDLRFAGVVERAVSAGPYQRTPRRNTNLEVHNSSSGALFQ